MHIEIVRQPAQPQVVSAPNPTLNFATEALLSPNTLFGNYNRRYYLKEELAVATERHAHPLVIQFFQRKISHSWKKMVGIVFFGFLNLLFIIFFKNNNRSQDQQNNRGQQNSSATSDEEYTYYRSSFLENEMMLAVASGEDKVVIDYLFKRNAEEVVAVATGAAALSVASAAVVATVGTAIAGPAEALRLAPKAATSTFNALTYGLRARRSMPTRIDLTNSAAISAAAAATAVAGATSAALINMPAQRRVLRVD
jgi:hypothetical protein